MSQNIIIVVCHTLEDSSFLKILKTLNLHLLGSISDGKAVVGGLSSDINLLSKQDGITSVVSDAIW